MNRTKQDILNDRSVAGRTDVTNEWVYTNTEVYKAMQEYADQESKSLRDTVERLDNSLRAKCKSTDEEIKLRDEQISRLNDKIKSQSQLIESLAGALEKCEATYKGDYEMPASKALKKIQGIAAEALTLYNNFKAK